MKPDGWSGSDTDEEYRVLGWLGTDGGNELRIYWYAGALLVKVTAVDESGFGDDVDQTLTLAESFGVYASTWTHVAIVLDLSNTDYKIDLYLGK